MIRRTFFKALFGVAAACYAPSVLKPLLDEEEGNPVNGRWLHWATVNSDVRYRKNDDGSIDVDWIRWIRMVSPIENSVNDGNWFFSGVAHR